MSARTILNPASNTVLEGFAPGVATVQSQAFPGNSVSLATGDDIAGINFSNSTTQWPSTTSAINFSNFALALTCQEGSGSSIALNSPTVSMSGHLSFGPNSLFKIIQGSFPCPALTGSSPFTTGNNIFSNAFVNPPSIFMSYQTANYATPAYTGLFTFTACGVSNVAFQAQLVGTVSIGAGTGTINYIAIGY